MKQIGILKLCVCLLLLSAVAYGVDTDVNNIYWNWSDGGLRMDTAEWSESGTVNQTAGNVTVQTTAYIGDNGAAEYNLSSGTFISGTL
jgi:hypothetical protein